MTRVSTTFLWLSLTIFISLALYHTSYKTEELDRSLRALNRQIEAERRSLHVLKAEYVFLTNPSRIEEVARKHLALQPTQPRQITQLSRLKDVAPTRLEAMNAAVKAGPIASLRPSTAAHSPLASATEADRVNTHLVIQKAETGDSGPDRSLAMIEKGEGAYDLAVSGDEP